MTNITLDLNKLNNSPWLLLNAIVDAMTRASAAPNKITDFILEVRGETYNNMLEISSRYVIIKPPTPDQLAQ